MTDQVYWYLKQERPIKLVADITTDVVIIGGGMAGLTAAQSFHNKGVTVTLLEKSFCGAGASGKSSGFITPDSEIPLHGFVSHFGVDRARHLWEFVTSGVELIRSNISQFGLSCDYIQEDTLVVANTPGGIDHINRENKARELLGYTSTLYSREEVPSVLQTSAYYSGVRYPDTFGINAYTYCQSMRNTLMQQGVKIFEETPALKLEHQLVHTPQARVKADKIIVCTDQFTPELGKLTNQVYHVQTYLLVSSQLSESAIKLLFPADRFMVWDTDLIYTYYRLTNDNRLLLGGGSLLTSYAHYAQHHAFSILHKLTSYMAQKFKEISLQFVYYWPGLIGISKDIMPIAGFDKDIPSIYYICAATGLPWAAALGNYCAEKIVNQRTDYDTYFSPYRSFPIDSLAQRLLGKQLSFALSNGISKKFIWR